MHVHSVFNKSPRAVFISNISYSQRLPPITAYVSHTLHLLASDPLNQLLSVILPRAIVYKLHSRVSTFKPPRPHLLTLWCCSNAWTISLLKMGERVLHWTLCCAERHGQTSNTGSVLVTLQCVAIKYLCETTLIIARVDNNVKLKLLGCLWTTVQSLDVVQWQHILGYILNHNLYPCEILNVPQMLTCTYSSVFLFENAVTLNRSALVELIEKLIEILESSNANSYQFS